LQSLRNKSLSFGSRKDLAACVSLSFDLLVKERHLAVGSGFSDKNFPGPIEGLKTKVHSRETNADALEGVTQQRRR
jgi:hypothetical protein